MEKHIEMIRNVIFDMGNVLLDWNPKERLKEMNFSAVHQKVVFEELFRSPEWILLDAGRIEIPEAISRVEDRLAYHVQEGFYPVKEEEIPKLKEEIRYVMDHPRDLVRPEEKIQFLPKALKEAGYRCYLLTNASTLFRAYEDKIPAFKAMDGIFVSAEHRMLKPDLEIYHAMLREFGLKTEESVFIDDNSANIAGAISCGMSGIVYLDDVDKLLIDLKRLEVVI